MNKTQLIERVASESELTKKDATKTVESVLTLIQETLAKGEKVEVMGFGAFNVSKRSARKGRNPQTGEEIEIQATTVPTFKAGKQLKEAVKS